MSTDANVQFGLTAMGAPEMFLDVTVAEYQSVVRSRRVLQFAADLEQKFEVVIGSFEDFERTLFQMGLELALRPGIKEDVEELERATANRILISFLSTASMYLDTMRRDVIDAFRRKSAVATTFSEIVAKERAKSDEFRIMDEFRNHVLHCALPVDVVIRRSGWDDTTPEPRLISVVTVITDIERLRKDDHFDQLMARIDELGSDAGLEIPPLVRLYVGGLARVHGALRELVAADVEMADETMRLMRNRAEAFANENIDRARRPSCLAGLCIERRPEVEGIPSAPVLLHPTRRRVVLESRNRHINALGRRSVTTIFDQAPRKR